MNIDLTPIIQAILALLAALITYKLVPWLKEKTTNEQRVYLKATLKTLVFAAEQLYGAGAGAEKLDYVICELKKRGFDADRAEIEATVNEFFGKISHETTTYTESMDVDDMTDNQIRAVLLQAGASMSDIEACTRGRSLKSCWTAMRWRLPIRPRKAARSDDCAALNHDTPFSAPAHCEMPGRVSFWLLEFDIFGGDENT